MAKYYKKLLLLVLTAVLVISPSQAIALSGSEFNPGRIIDDSVFFNGSALDANGVQQFLNSKVPSCDTNGTKPYAGTTRAAYGASKGYPAPYICLRNFSQDTTTKPAESGLCNQYNGGTKTAAQIIADIGVACGVSQMALIVLLEKEQSLVTDDWPWSTQYQSATGYGCPDTAPCDSEYFGFFNQVYNAAKQFKRYGRDASLFSYRAGRDNYVQYNPNAACGGTSIFIQNQATAGLYNYTPYQPNLAALNNLNGTGDSCSAYGNRNFWRLYKEWFGRTTFENPLKWGVGTVSQSDGKSNIFIRGYDNRLWQNWFDNSGWQAKWNYIQNPADGASATGSISFGNGHMDVFATINGELWHSWYASDSTGWRGWSPLGRPAGVSIVGTPAVVSQTPGKINVFARGNDGRLWQTWFDGNGWNNGWNYIDGQSSGTSAPTAISFGNGHMDVFAIKNGAIWHSWYSVNGGWRQWSPLGNPGSTGLRAMPTAIERSSNKINVFARGNDGRLWQTWFDGNGWNNGWNYIDGPINEYTEPTSLSWNGNHMEIFETRNGYVWHTWYAPDSTAWRPWSTLGMP